VGEPSTATPSRAFDFSLRVAAPGPRGPALLNVPRFFAHPAWFVLDRMVPDGDGPVLPIADGRAALVVVRGSDAVRQVCTDTETFPRLSDGLFAIPRDRVWSSMTRNVVTANGAEHRRARRLLMPIVQRSALEHYRGVFARTFAESALAERQPGTAFDLMPELWAISRRNMVVAILGLPPTEANLQLGDDVVAMLDQMLHPAVMLARIDHPWTPHGRWLQHVERLYHAFERLIEQKRDAPPAPDALSILCHTTDEHGDTLSTSEIAGELGGLFGAGFETTAATMMWALLVVLASPLLQMALRDGDPEVLDVVVKESQRVLPAVPVGLPKRVAADVPIAGGPTVPRGAVLFFAPVIEHHDASSFPDPATFRPARWRGATVSPYEFLPYGVGARRCLGAAFADLQVRETIAALMARPEPLELMSGKVDVRIHAGATALPKAPVHVRFRSAAAGVGDPVPVTGSVTKLWNSVVDVDRL
jgi:cytochrome P450